MGRLPCGLANGEFRNLDLVSQLFHQACMASVPHDAATKQAQREGFKTRKGLVHLLSSMTSMTLSSIGLFPPMGGTTGRMNHNFLLAYNVWLMAGCVNQTSTSQWE